MLKAKLMLSPMQLLMAQELIRKLDDAASKETEAALTAGLRAIGFSILKVKGSKSGPKYSTLQFRRDLKARRIRIKV